MAVETRSSKKMKLSSSSVCVSTGTINNDHHKLDNLPELVYHYLFKYLDLDDVFELRLVSKTFTFIVQDYHPYITQLSFLNYDDYYNDDRGNWFSTTKSIRLRNQLGTSKLGLLINPSNDLINLKYLRIMSSKMPIKIEDLNKFTKLQILVIDGISMKSNDSLLLHLPDLKALSISFLDESSNLIVDCPNLHSLHLYNNYDDLDEYYDDYNDRLINQIKFKNPETVKYLEFDYHDDNISKFRNLECLEVDSLREDFEVNGLSMLKNLKKLRINRLRYSDNKELKNLFKLKRKDLEIVLSGVKIKEINKLDEYTENESELEFQLSNYDELEDDLNREWDINYNDLIRLFTNNQPSDLFRKYNNIQKISIYARVEDENRLINFISECQNLFVLLIKGSSLSQQFYDRLPAICLLSELTMYENDINLNYEFLKKITYLKRFKTDQDVVINLNLNHLNRLKKFKFTIRSSEISIDKNGKDRYKMWHHDRLVSFGQKYCSLDEINKWLDDLRKVKRSDSN